MDAVFHSPNNQWPAFRFPTKQLRRITKSFSGGTPSTTNFEYWSGTIPWASAKDLKQFYLDDTEDHISEKAVADSATRMAPIDSVLIVVRSGILKHTFPVSINRREVAINQDLKVLTPSSAILGRFLGYFLLVFNRYILLRALKHSTTVQSINSFEFERLEIPIPGIDFQNKVIDLLDNVLAAQSERYRKADEVMASIDGVVLDALGIELPEKDDGALDKRIFYTNSAALTGRRIDPLYYSKDHFEFLSKGRYCDVELKECSRYFLTGFAAGRQDQVDEEGVIQIRPTNFSNDRQLVFERNVLIDRDEVKKRPNDVLKKREVLFNNTNSQELVGKTAYFDLDGDYFCSNHVTRISTDESRLSPKYLAAVLNLYQHSRIFFRICTNWNNQSGINIELLKHIPIPLPPLEVQAEIVEKVDAIYAEAKRLRREGDEILAKAKEEVERMLLGEV